MSRWLSPEGLAALGAIATALVTLAVAGAAWSSARFTRREFELTRRPLVTIDDWQFLSESDTVGELVGTVKEVTGVPTALHQVRYTLIPGDHAQDTLSSPTTLYRDIFTHTMHFGAVTVAEQGELMALLNVRLEFSIEQSPYIETLEVWYEAGRSADGVVVTPSSRPESGRRRRRSRRRRAWEEWKRGVQAGFPWGGIR